MSVTEFDRLKKQKDTIIAMQSAAKDNAAIAAAYYAGRFVFTHPEPRPDQDLMEWLGGAALAWSAATREYVRRLREERG